MSRATPFTVKQREALQAERAALQQQLVANICGELMLIYGGKAALQDFKARLKAKGLPVPKRAGRTRKAAPRPA